MGIALVIISVFILLCIIVTPILGVISKLIFRVTTGVFGLFAYPLFLSTLLWGVALIQGRKVSLSVRSRVLIGVMAFSLMMILQLATTHAWLSENFSAYTSKVYHGTTAGGVLFGTVAFGIQSVITPVVSYLLFSLAFVAMGALLVYPLIRHNAVARNEKAIKNQVSIVPFVKGNASAQPVVPMTDTTLFVDTIRPTAENNAPIERYDEQRARVATVTETPVQTAVAPQPSTGDMKEDARRILFGDHERYMSNLSAQNAATPKIDYQQEKKQYWNSYTLPPLSTAPTVIDNTEKEPEPFVPPAPVAPARPQKRVHVEGLREIPKLPEKDISDQIVGGTIINGEDYSEQLAERNAPIKEEKTTESIPYEVPRAVDFSIRKAEPTRLRPREQAVSEVAQAPIMNGDYFTVDPDMPAKAANTERVESVRKEETLSPFAPVHTQEREEIVKEEPFEQAPIISASQYESEHSPEARFQQLLNEERSKREETMRTPTESTPFANEFAHSDEHTLLTIDDEPEDLSEQSHFEGEDMTGYYETVVDAPVIKPFVAEKPVHAKTASVTGQTSMTEYMQNASVPPVKKRRKVAKYVAPSLDILIPNDSVAPSDTVECEEKGRMLEATLKELKLPASVIEITRGPAVTRYELEMPPGVPIKRIEQYSADIAYNLASNGKIRIETPIPGKRAVGVEVPNAEIAIVRLHEIIGSKEFQNSSSPLTIALGKDIAGSNIICNLEKMPHLLIAGATGSGKSACLNSIIMSILYKSSPEDVRLILIDPKRVEFNMYRGMPHLISEDIINEASQAINALTWAREEMERRYVLFGKHCVRNLQEFNKCDAVKDGTEQKLPYIVMIVDELAELMLDSNNRKELENKIMSIAQKARAAGIHMILATQRPTVDVITGTIKANLPSRIAFAVKSMVDSRTILDECGAETLLGRGDMLYAPQGVSDPMRVQGAFVTDKEVAAVTEFVRDNNEADFDDEFTTAINKKDEPESGEDGGDEDDKEFDSLMPDVLKCVIESGAASTSMIQRRFSVGYARASRIIDQMELHKFIGPLEGSKPRSVYISREQYKELFGIDL
ncbi:MAG: DUF87 domain-containing protein [Clostridiales bacterium]|nr:DUF87 domain-containing protein [Clostridiales bacterium]